MNDEPVRVITPDITVESATVCGMPMIQFEGAWIGKWALPGGLTTMNRQYAEDVAVYLNKLMIERQIWRGVR